MKESVRQSVEAGLNVRCTFRSPDSYVLPLRELVKEGAISMETIDERVRDILRVKFIVGLFDTPYQEDLKAADVETLGDLVSFNRNDLLKFRNFGKKSLTELEDLLVNLNLSFGMDIGKYKLDKE